MTNRFLFGAAVLFSSITITAQEKPNVVIILADDMGYGDVSAFNPNSKFRTPNIDSIGRNGIIFTDAHSTASVSTPSRYGIITGQYAFRTFLKSGNLNGWSPPLIKEGRRTIGNMFQDNGYNTACIGKWHLGWNWVFDGNPEDENVDFSKAVSNGVKDKGFDYSFCLPASLDMPPYVFVENGVPTAVPDRIEKERKGIQLLREGPIASNLTPETCLPLLRSRTLNYISSRKDEKKPFFLYVPLTAPHTPILPEERFKGMSGMDEYGDFVLMVDDFVGQVSLALKQAGLSDNTILIFTSDNGPAWSPCKETSEAAGHSSTYIYRGRKFDLYEGGHRMPLLISWGNRYKSRKYGGLISLSDFYATFADMFGYRFAYNEAEDSQSFWPVLKSRKGRSKRTSMAYQSGSGYLAFRSGRWKLIFTPSSGGRSFPNLEKDKDYIMQQPEVQLYDIIEDPSEKVNLAENCPNIVRKLSLEMRQLVLSGRSFSGEPVPENYSGPWKQAAYFLNNLK